MKIHTQETDSKDWGQYFTDYDIIFEDKNELQHLILLSTKSYGKVLLVDGVVQVTEKDNFIYHEMLTHVPILSHGDCRRVLVIGGGDGGMIKEVLKYENIQVTMVEIDNAVIEFSRKYLPSISNDAFDNNRLSLHIADGAKFVKETNEKFDVIIVDSTDPIGPGKVLFSKEFYTNCSKVLTEGGVLVTQNGIPFTQPNDLENSLNHLDSLFSISTCYIAAIPTYVGGHMAFGFATNDIQKINMDADVLNNRFIAANVETEYYTPEIHKAAFVLPQYIQKLVP